MIRKGWSGGGLILNADIKIKTYLNKYGDDKEDGFGRPIVEIYLNGENLNDWLVLHGFAEYKDY